MSSDSPELSFADLNLPSSILQALSDVGYETPSPIQAATIPLLLQGKDVVGMAQTGTGKTAAFALPVLADIDLNANHPQALVLCPTRELAIQVAEAFQSYAAHLKGFHVLPIYGGQDMRGQLKALKRGVHVVVGTPGRTLDHLNRKSLALNKIKTIVLDEADEMLRMGFIDDVEAILDKTPEDRRVALFSATMPAPIRKVANNYLNEPEEIQIKTKVTTNENIEQLYWLVSGTNKLDALTRILEVEEFDGMIIFVRTKTSTVELADKLNARGYSASALNGDMSQNLRIQTVEQLKRGSLDILVATDVAARGLDVERISHVMNYDIPYDDEAYVHRIGRTGRAGRTGKAILFVAPRERRLLRSIEKTTRKPITQMDLPTRSDLIEYRSKAFKDSVVEAMQRDDLDFFANIVKEISEEQNCSENEVGAALAYLVQKDRPLQPPKEKAKRERKERDFDQDDSRQRRKGRDGEKEISGYKAKPLKDHPDVEMQRFKVAVGRKDNVKPGQIVGAIANEAEIDGDYIGNIEIYETFSTVDLPAGMPKEVFNLLKQTMVCNRALNIDIFTEKPPRGKPGKSRLKSEGGDRRGKGHKRPSNENRGKRDKNPHRGKGKADGGRSQGPGKRAKS
ncbi:MAG: DEAD/DEAH box helicase [Pseudomonadales bacterium]|nr:DEAD/DEAH box helicase [Pseudomonadales bacterium]